MPASSAQMSNDSIQSSSVFSSILNIRMVIELILLIHLSDFTLNWFIFQIKGFGDTNDLVPEELFMTVSGQNTWKFLPDRCAWMTSVICRMFWAQT